MYQKGKAICLTLLLALFLAVPALAEMVAVDGDKVNLRSGPGIKYKVQWELGNGYPLQIIERKGTWLKVKDFEGDQGWVSKNSTTSRSHMIVKANKNSSKRINLRSRPNTKSSVVAMAHYGVVFRVLEKKNDWVKVRHEKGVEGWISKSFLWGF